MGHKALAQLLIHHEAHINIKDQDGFTPFHMAALKGHEAIAELLIRNGANVNAKDKDDKTPLYLAAGMGHKALAQLLIRNGANVNAKDKDEFTPFHMATLNGHKASAQLLIRNGADVNAKDQEDKTLLYKAAIIGDKALAQLLIDNGADVNVKDKDGYTLLQKATEHGNNVSAWQTAVILAGATAPEILSNHLIKKIVRKAINTFEEPTVTDKTKAAILACLTTLDAKIPKEQETVLETVIQENKATDQKLLQDMLKIGFDPNKPGKNGETPVIIAARTGNENALQLLKGGKDAITQDTSPGKKPTQDTVASFRQANNNRQRSAYQRIIDNKLATPSAVALVFTPQEGRTSWRNTEKKNSPILPAQLKQPKDSSKPFAPFFHLAYELKHTIASYVYDDNISSHLNIPPALTTKLVRSIVDGYKKERAASQTATNNYNNNQTISWRDQEDHKKTHKTREL